MTYKQILSQINNWKTVLMYLRQMRTLASSTFIYDGMPDYIDMAVVNDILIKKGSVAFFVEEELNQLLALSYTTTGRIDVYGRPYGIEVFGSNGYHRKLEPEEYVIMYDNLGRYPLEVDIIQYAIRMALSERTRDVNVSQLKTPRVWQVPQEMERSFRDLVNNVNSMNNEILTHDGLLALSEIQCVLQPAPLIIDKLNEDKNKIWNEFLRLIGIANSSFEKKERNVRDEVIISQGGTIASRTSRFEPRQKALKQIKDKFGYDIKVEFYDGLPTTLVSNFETVGESAVNEEMTGGSRTIKYEGVDKDV